MAEVINNLFQSTLPIREETVNTYADFTINAISIHSSHTGRDQDIDTGETVRVLFQSTLPIREETESNSNPAAEYGFQSTLPIREETSGYVTGTFDGLFQSTLPIREETITIAHKTRG